MNTSKKNPKNQPGPGHGILLEAGTNELEVLLFSLDGQSFGINVAKLREITSAPEIRRLPESPPALEGVFLLRGQAVPLLGLRTFLRLRPYAERDLADARSTAVLVTEFNRRRVAFRVDGVEQIVRVASDQIDPLPRLASFGGAPITAMVRLQERLVSMLDFEVIAAEITGAAISLAGAGPLPQIDRSQRRVVVAEDSMTVQKMIAMCLRSSGYAEPRLFDNGKLAWAWLGSVARGGEAAVREAVDIVITDVEMPQMDGLQLCRLIREDPALQRLPVVLFSSLVTEDNRRKGESVGATAQISKPELGQVVELMDQILGTKG